MDEQMKITAEDVVDAARDVAAKLKRDVADSLSASAQDVDAARKAARAASGWQGVSQVAAGAEAAQVYIARMASAINRNIAEEAARRPVLGRSRELMLAYARFALEAAAEDLDAPYNAVALLSALEHSYVDHDMAVFRLTERVLLAGLIDDLVPSLAGTEPLYPASAEKDDITAVGTVTSGMEAAMAAELRKDKTLSLASEPAVAVEDAVHRYCEAEMSEQGLWDNALSYDRYSMHVEEIVEYDREWFDLAREGVDEPSMDEEAPR